MSECRESSQNVDQDEVLNLLRTFKVLVIDHNANYLTSSVACLLNSCSFEVTCVDHFGAALKMLSKKKNEFDLLLIDNDIPDVDVHAFLRWAKKMDLISIVMAEDGDDTLVLEALWSGASLVLEKPLTIDAVRHIRQGIIKDRIKKNAKCPNKSMIRNATTLEKSTNDNKRFNSKRKDINEPMKNVIATYHDDNLVYESAENVVDDDSIKKETCMDWAEELHEKFLDAIGRLGDGGCYPEEILELMDVPGLTGRHVVNHLQVCREGKWNSNEKGTKSGSSRDHALAIEFGRMPSSQIDKNDEDNGEHIVSLGRCEMEVNQSSAGSPTENGSST